VPAAIMDIRSLARKHTESCIRSLATIAAKGESESARVAAIGVLLDRGWGKAPQAHTGENGEGDIRVIVRHILDTRDKPAAQAHLASEVSVLPLTIDHRDGESDG